MSHTEKRRILFICTHNSARSQMAEGFVKTLYPDNYEVFSGGTEPSQVNPYVIKVMAELGIDISGQYAKNVNEFLDRKIDYVVTVCDQAQATCPFFPGGKTYLHKSFQDPSVFQGTEEEILEQVRKVRDEIKDWIEKTFNPRLKKHRTE
jgi:arsenate reductase